MASNWRGIVHVRENEDRRPLWQRRTSRRTPTTVAESGSESGGAATTTSSGGSRSSSADEDRLDSVDRLSAPQLRTVQQLSPIFTNRTSGIRFDNRSSSVVGRSSSFRDSVPTALAHPSTPTPSMGGYRRSVSPYGNARHPPMSARSSGGGGGGDHLTADYVPSWRPDRRFSTPAVQRHRGSFSRSPSPRFIGKKGAHQFEYFRSRAASLPASNASINAAAAASGSAVKKLKQRQQQQQQSNSTDYWPQTRSPSRVEQRFLKLSESADYDKVRTFVIGAKGELVERGFCYRHRSETASSSSAGSTGPTASPNDDAAIVADPITVATLVSNQHVNYNETGTPDPFPTRVVPRYPILIIGAPSVGKSSILSLLKKSQEFRSDEISVGGSVDNEHGVVTIVPVLICGEEVHLEFYEFCVSDEHLWAPVQWQAAVVLYSISDKRSFSAAADVLHQIRVERRRTATNEPTQPIPIVLVANKIDLERQRQVQDQDGMELAKSYDCRFVDVSVELSHHVEDLLSSVMNEIWRRTVTAYRQRQMQDGSQHCPGDEYDDDNFQTEKKPKRFSFRKYKRPKPSASRDLGGGGQPRSSRARSLYALPAGLPSTLSGPSLILANSNANNHQHNGGGFLSRLLGRRAVQSCEDLFSRLLRG